MLIPLLVFGLCLACGDPHAHESTIVRELEAAGSGNLSHVTTRGLEVFLAHRKQLAHTVNQQCQPLWPRADAHWVATAEGKACYAASIVDMPTWKGDARVW